MLIKKLTLLGTQSNRWAQCSVYPGIGFFRKLIPSPSENSNWDIPLIPLWLKKTQKQGLLRRAVHVTRARGSPAEGSQKCNCRKADSKGGRDGICWTTWWMLGFLKDHTRVHRRASRQWSGLRTKAVNRFGFGLIGTSQLVPES